ncbi:MAG TPA: flavin reductase family protein [Terriglobales bacterium]|jgi:flavin reductase (DIM6/NTAB) family NADH-FMN oxidoreductase RutF|nr:flavin reductase family protein [Terriglobales bacterium]
MSLNQADFRKAMGSFATGVTVITIDQEGEIHGMTANAFTSVSLDPMLVLVCVDHRARTHAHLHARKRFGVNVLASHQRSISEYYARTTAKHQHAEEAGARFERTGHGTPVLQEALAYLECKLHSAQDAGDHTIFIGEVEDVVVREGNPLTYFRGKYRHVGPNVESEERATTAEPSDETRVSGVTKR